MPTSGTFFTVLLLVALGTRLGITAQSDPVAAPGQEAGQAARSDEQLSDAARLAMNARLLVLNQKSPTIHIMDRTGRRRFATLPTGARPHEGAVSLDDAYAFIALYGERSVSFIDLTTSRLRSTIKVGDAPEIVRYAAVRPVAEEMNGSVVPECGQWIPNEQACWLGQEIIRFHRSI